MSHNPLSARLAAAAAATLLAGSLVAAGAPGAAAATGSADRSSRVAGCAAADLAIQHGRREGAAGHRFDRFRVTNTASSACRLAGYPTFHFRNGAGDPIGHDSTHAGVQGHAVVLDPGDHTRIEVGTVDPGVVGRSECKPRRARSVAITLPHRPHVFVVPLRLTVCTTTDFRPTSFPFGF
jgi:hypothetical protein